MPTLATFNDFVCNDFGCKRVATKFHGFYGSEERDGRTMLHRLKNGLICNVHVGGIKRRSFNRGDTFIDINALGPEWDEAKAEYLAERKAAHDADLTRQEEQRRENQRLAKARFAQAWVERNAETEPEITHGTDYSSYGDRFRDGFTIGGDSWHGNQVVVEQDGRYPATVKVTSSGQWSPIRAQAVAKALLMAADMADMRDVTNGLKVRE